MPWWWPFKKERDAAQAEHNFRESLREALLRQDDLQAATARLKASRKKKREEPSVEAPKPRARNA